MMDAPIPTQGDAVGEIWPALPYPEWQDTLDTLHMWTQIVGKVKLELVPFLNEWWNVAFSLTARGLTTSTIPGPPGARHRIFQFYHEFMAALDELGLHVPITTSPQEVENPIPFDQDQVHASYDPASVTHWWRILLQVDCLLQQYRTPFVGKSSPVLFWWGSFDLSEARFSGRPAPQREWPTRWMALGADQEEAAAGFWPGNRKLAQPAFFAYTYPEPPGYREATIRPDAASYHLDLREFILPYEEVRKSPSPDQRILDFFQSAYEIGATLAGWDRAALERPDPLRHQKGARR